MYSKYHIPKSNPKPNPKSNPIKYFTQFGKVFIGKLVGYNIVGRQIYENTNTGYQFLV